MRMFSLFMFIAALAVLNQIVADSPSKKDLSLHFFMHDMVDLTNPSKGTVVYVAAPNNNLATLQPFGSVLVIDDKLTEGPSIDSKLVGRAQGNYITDSTSAVSVLFSFAAVFENGSISFHGQDPIAQPVREIAAIGGTGAFRSVTGYAQVSTYKFLPPFSAVLEFHVFLKQAGP